MKVLITGGTGTLGRALVKLLLEDLDAEIESIRILSRNEFNQAQMRAEYADDYRMRFLLGDVRDLGRVRKAARDTDWIIHAAALKRAEFGQYEPEEFVKTNVLGSQNVITAAIEEARLGGNISKVTLVSSDKACSPALLYGTSKMLAEGLFCTANYSQGTRYPVFSSVRYGNVIGSTGSVIPLYQKLKAEGKPFPVTDISMTRFAMTIEAAARFVYERTKKASPGYIAVPKLPALNILDIVGAFDQDDYSIIGMRPGEKLDEILISREELSRVIEREDYYMIRPHQPLGGDDLHPSTSLTAEYSSATAPKLTVGEIKELIDA